MKNILVGLAVVVGALWALLGIGVLFTAGYYNTHPLEGTYQWTIWSWVAIVPELAFGVGCILLLLWGLGAHIRGEDS